MRVLVYFSLVQFGLCLIRLPNQTLDKDTLTTLGIKTLGWQGEEQSSSSQIHVHHNYSKVSVQNPGISQSSSFGGQKSVDEDDYFDSTAQRNVFGGQQQLENDDQGQEQDLNGFSQTQTNWFGGQQKLDLEDQQTDQNQDDYDFSSYDNNKIYNAHSQGNRLKFDQVMEAENLNNQQFEEFPDYETGQLQLIDQAAEGSEPEERQAKHFYPVDKPIYIHGFKYPPEDPVDPGNQPPEVHTECPKLATGQFVHPASCNQFLNCWKGRGYVQNCAPGTLFNPKTLECDFATKVKCLTGPRKPEQNEYMGGKLKISCPAGFSGVVPHHSDCSKFINCANGIENVMDCPPGTLFNLKINNCDFPYKTECASWSVQFGNYTGQIGVGHSSYGNKFGANQGSSGTHGYGQGFSSGNQNSYGTHGGSGYHGSQQTNQGSYGSGSVNQQTQTGSSNTHGYGQGASSGNQNSYGTHGGSGYHGPQQTNQGSYGSGSVNQQTQTGSSGAHGYGQGISSGNQNSYGTHGGKGYHGSQQTNQGLYGSGGINQQTQTGSSGAHGYGQGTSSGNQNSYGTHEGKGYHGSQQTNQGSYGSGSVNQHTQTGYGNEELDSKQYYGQNQNGNKGNIGAHGSQNQGQYFDHGLQQTNQGFYGSGSVNEQTQTGYENGGQNHNENWGYDQNQGSHSKNQGQNSNYGQGAKVNQNPNALSSNRRAKCPDGETGLFPHPSDCAKFLNCANGQTFIQDCGPGTVFNPVSKVCDFPYNVKCDQNEDYQHLIDVRTKSSKPVCPQHASGLYPHPTICSKFLNCANGQTFIQDCGPGTVFNPTSKVCDFPYNVECGSNFGEGLIDVKSVPWQPPSNTNLNSNKNQQEGFYGENTGQNHNGHGQATDWNTNWQQGGTTQGSGIGQDFYVQNSGGGNQQQGSYDQEKAEGQGGQHGTYGQSSNGQGSYGQGQSGSYGTGGQHGTYGQNSHAQESHGQGQSVSSGQGSHGQGSYGTGGQHGTYHGQGQSGQGAHEQGSYGTYSQNSNSHGQGSYGQGHADSSLTQQGSYDVTENQQEAYGLNSNKHGSYGSSSSQGSYGTATQHGHAQSHTGSSGGSQQGSYGSGSQQGSYGQGSYGQNSNTQGSYGSSSSHGQQGFYGQNKITEDDQEIQESKQHNQKTGNALKPHHSPPPFPSTDLNADYEFGNEDTTSINSKPFPKRKPYCEPLDFHCNQNDCIPQSMICDGVKDCPNAADERNCEKYLHEFKTTPNTILAVREKEKFVNISLVYCAKSCLESKGFQCKSFSYRKEDGACFLTDSNVGNSGALIISHPYAYYEAKTFSINCTGLYKCPNQKCINFKQVCDGINDCGDRSDEKGCSAQAFGYQIQLRGTDKKHEGRIEVKAFGKWGYICDDKFGLRDADVVCRELGFPLGSLEVKANSYYAQDVPEEDVFYMMDDVTCLGNESSVRDCDFNGWGVNNCESQEVVGVVCKTPLEKCPKDYWKCDAQECIPINFVCDGVFDCTDQSDERDEYCDAPIEVRLVDGAAKSEGRVEIRYHGIWGTVCDDDFNDDAAKVVCKSLGFPGQAVAKKDGFFGAGKGPIWLDQVFCQGKESSLEHCVHWNWGEHNCEHAEDVGVACSNTYDVDLEAGSERRAKIDEPQINDVLPEYLFPERCGLRKDDQFLEDDAVHFRVVKGSIAKSGDYPWQASLKIKNKSKPTHWCGAVVISQKFVLTAAHCLAGFAKGAYFIVAGDYNTDEAEGTEQEAFIEEFYVHEKFRIGHKMNNDVAIIKLKGKGLVFTKNVQPICLPDSDLAYQTGLNCTISGFGSIESGKSGYSHQLRAGWVPLQSMEVCKMPHVYGTSIKEGMICAGSLDEGVDACDGDSGGPLACLHDGLFTLYGLTSWGHHCGYANKPGVYVKVSHYRDWIDETIRKHS